MSRSSQTEVTARTCARVCVCVLLYVGWGPLRALPSGCFSDTAAAAAQAGPIQARHLPPDQQGVRASAASGYDRSVALPMVLAFTVQRGTERLTVLTQPPLRPNTTHQHVARFVLCQKGKHVGLAHAADLHDEPSVMTVVSYNLYTVQQGRSHTSVNCSICHTYDA